VLAFAAMFGSEILDVAIGVIFVFLLVSLICSAVREGIEAWMKSRATHLEQGIRELLHDPHATGLARALYEHPMVSVLYHDTYTPTDTIKFWTTALTRGRNLPSYIPSRNFAVALMDMAVRGPVVDAASSDASAGAMSVDELRNNIASLGNPAVQRVLLTALDTAQGDLEKVQKNIEAWYDASMDRVSGWYKRSTQVILFFIGMGVAIALNINTLTIADYLYRDKAARDALVAQAQGAVANPLAAQGTYEQVQTKLLSLKLPIGWQQGFRASLPQKRDLNGVPRQGTIDWIQLITGLLISAFAATVGAPFWFDLLNKVMVIRSTVKPHEKSREEASEDRQAKNGADAKAPAQAPATASGPPAAQAGASTTPPPATSPAPASAPQHPDHIDGCDVDFVDFTPDEELPAAQGGVG
jgi:hypothetical protein